MHEEKILIVDFGGQYSQIIARKVRDAQVYCELVPSFKAMDALQEDLPKGIIFTGGPGSALADNAPTMDPAIYNLGIPILALPYGMQRMAQDLGGKVEALAEPFRGQTETTFQADSPLFKGLTAASDTWILQEAQVTDLPPGFTSIASAEAAPIAAMAKEDQKLYGLHFLPEAAQTQEGKAIINHFLFDICGCQGGWTMANYARKAIADIKEEVGDGKVLLALSGGVDSSVVAKLISTAIGDQLTCIFVDHGLMRKNEADEVQAAFADSGMHFIRVEGEDRFLARLAGVTDPETKRKIIGEEFIRVFEEEGRKIGSVDYLAQGTIYPDIIESGGEDGKVIKSHHNVGGLPAVVDFKGLIEPLRLLFKDEVRQLGLELGLADYLVWRQPFPGPGLGIRVMGELTKEKLDILRDADAIYREEIAQAGLDRAINQYFAVLTSNRTVGITGDARTYDYTLALRAVETTDFMTAQWARIPYEVLDKISHRIVAEVDHINRIVYDITSKPPATIEWE